MIWSVLLGSSKSILKSPASAMLSIHFNTLLSEFEICLKNFLLLKFGGRYANKTHHFLLEMVSSIQIDSMLGLSQWDNLLATMPSRTKTIFPPLFESWSFLNRGNWYPLILNWLSRKLVSSLVSSMQSISILAVEMISLKQIIFSFKEFMLR